jgi:hypothetical protein
LSYNIDERKLGITCAKSLPLTVLATSINWLQRDNLLALDQLRVCCDDLTSQVVRISTSEPAKLMVTLPVRRSALFQETLGSDERDPLQTACSLVLCIACLTLSICCRRIACRRIIVHCLVIRSVTSGQRSSRRPSLQPIPLCRHDTTSFGGSDASYHTGSIAGLRESLL